MPCTAPLGDEKRSAKAIFRPGCRVTGTKRPRGGGSPKTAAWLSAVADPTPDSPALVAQASPAPDPGARGSNFDDARHHLRKIAISSDRLHFLHERESPRSSQEPAQTGRARRDFLLALRWRSSYSPGFGVGAPLAR